MVAANPMFSGKWTLKKLKSTVLNDIWPEMMFFCGVATMVCCVNKFTTTDLAISNQMLTVLGTVLGLVISFRTSSAYDRYWEGRKLWGTIMLQSRNLGQIIWIHVPIHRDGKMKDDKGKTLPDEGDSRLRAIIERKSMVNLVQAFSVSVKHYLRSEPGIYYEDLYPLISLLPHDISGEANARRSLSTPDALPLWDNHEGMPKLRKTSSDPSKRKSKGFDPEKVLPQIDSHVPLRPARNPPRESITDYLPIFAIFKPIGRLIKKMIRPKEEVEEEDGLVGTRNFLGRKIKAPPIESNVPLEIVLFLSSYLQMLLKNGLLQPAIATAYVNSLTSLQDCVANLERIRTTPIPFAYQAHLRMSVWLYLLFLPFEIYNAFEWMTIPATAFAVFMYIGFLEIGQEIENPFEYDANDLDLDHFCLTIERELAEITAHPAFDPSTYIFSMWNQPFAPADRRSATDILNHVDHDYHKEEEGIQSVRRTMLKSFKEISEATHNGKY